MERNKSGNGARDLRGSFFIYFNWRLITFVVVFAIHRYEAAMGIHVSHHAEPPSHLLPHPVPLSCPRVPALGALFHALNLHWSSILHFKLEDKCFTVLCCFCHTTWTSHKCVCVCVWINTYICMCGYVCVCVYIYPLLFGPPSHSPPYHC